MGVVADGVADGVADKLGVEDVELVGCLLLLLLFLSSSLTSTSSTSSTSCIFSWYCLLLAYPPGL